MHFNSVSSQRYFFGVSVFLILLFTMLEPESIAGASVLASLIFFIIQFSILMPLLIYTHGFLQKIPFFEHLNPWLKTGLAGFTASLVFVPIGLGIDYIMGLDDWSNVKTPEQILSLGLEETIGIVGPVTLTWIAINAPRILQLNFQNPAIPDAKQNETEPPPSDEPCILSLIPHDLGRDIIYLMSELHYLRIVTTKGETLQLYNLQNAMEELKMLYDGLQTHRSYWINKIHAEKIVGKAPDRKILMKQGYVIPISRRKYTNIKSHFN